MTKQQESDAAFKKWLAETYGENAMFEDMQAAWRAALDWSRPRVEAVIKRLKAQKPKRIKVESPSKFVWPDWLPLPVVAGFEEMRKRLRKPLTDRARQLTVNALLKLKAQGEDPVACLDQSTQLGWQGVFPLRQSCEQVQGPQAQAEKHAPGDMSDSERRLYRQFEEREKARASA